MSTIDMIVAVLAIALVIFTIVYNVKKGNKCAYCEEGCCGKSSCSGCPPTCEGQGKK